METAVKAIKDKVDHDYSMQFTPSYYLLRDLYRIIGEKPEEEQFGIAFADEQMVHLWDKNWSNDNQQSSYFQMYRDRYPHTIFYFWNGQDLEKMERVAFFTKLRQVFLA